MGKEKIIEININTRTLHKMHEVSEICTPKNWKFDVFTHLFLPTDMFPHGDPFIYTQTLSHSDAFAHKQFHTHVFTQPFLHFFYKHFYTRTFSTRKIGFTLAKFKKWARSLSKMSNMYGTVRLVLVLSPVRTVGTVRLVQLVRLARYGWYGW